MCLFLINKLEQHQSITGVYKHQNGISVHIPHCRPQKVINSFKTVLQPGKKGLGVSIQKVKSKFTQKG